MVIRTERDGDTVIVVLDGHLDLASVNALKERVSRAESTGHQRIVIDLSALELIDDAGVNVLLREQMRLLENGRQVTLLRGPPAVHAVFERSRVLHLFSFEDEAAVSDRAGDASPLRSGPQKGVLDVLQDFDDLGGGSIGLVAWELGVEEAVIAHAWSTAIEERWLAPAGIDTVYGEEMWRITERGLHARQIFDQQSS